MKCNQGNATYQNINGQKGRDCEERWEFISHNLPLGYLNTFLDVGSAEGYFVKKLTDLEKIVYSFEVSALYNVQINYVKSENAFIYQKELNEKNIDEYIKKIDVTLLFSVLHWFDNPDIFLEKIVERSKYVVVELPSFGDKRSANYDYMERIKKDYGTIDNYLISRGLVILNKKNVSAKHVNKDRVVYICESKI